jgi:hypothetical protein
MRVNRFWILGSLPFVVALGFGAARATTPAFVPPPGVPRPRPSSLLVPVPTPPPSVSVTPVPFIHTPVKGDPCREANAPEPSPLREQPGPKRLFSIDGYVARALRIYRAEGASTRNHCISVAWPPGDMNTAGKKIRVAQDLDAAWFRAIENTLSRLPWSHVQVIHRFVIDDRPTLHGVAPYDRQAPDDARDGHTIWLHSHLFRDQNHWVRGNHGKYWGYHTNRDGVAFDGRPKDHELFSPVLLHEIGHTVMYNLVNPAAEAVSTPGCARTCADEPEGCAKLGPALRETGCITAYCSPFDFPGSTENWAELYRFHYQSSATRALLERSGTDCGGVLATLDLEGRGFLGAPWERGLPDMPHFRRTRWKSCGEQACKPW